MDFTFPQEAMELREAILKFARKELNAGLAERDRKGEFNWEGWRKSGEFGLLGLPVPVRYGGQEAGISTATLAMEALGYACEDRGFCLAVAVHTVLGEIPLLLYGSERQKDKYLPLLASGRQIAAYALTEPEAGSDALSLRTSAKNEGGKYFLNGTKVFITNGPIADLILVFATVDPSLGPKGITAFLVEKGMPGFRVTRVLDKMGLRTSPTAEMVFEECEVPEENLLGRPGEGISILFGTLEWERACLLASTIGAMERQVEYTVRYAGERVQFGKPIGKFQAVSHRIVDMKVRLEAGRLLLYKVAWLKEKGIPAMLEAAMAKLFISEASKQNALEALQIHGAYGYTTEFPCEKDLRDAIPSTIGAGSSEVQRNVIAKCLGL